MNFESIRVVLASKSPRRRELLSRLIPSFEVLSFDIDETLCEGEEVRRGVELLAVRKGEAALKKLGEDVLIISSDTLVEMDGVSLGKPRDRSDAVRMLLSMSGRRHFVHTGVAVHYRGRMLSGIASSGVLFRNMSEQEVKEYVDGGEPMDKAGSYGIQGEGGKFVLGYDGDFDTIVGLSLRLTERLISDILKGE